MYRDSEGVYHQQRTFEEARDDHGRWTSGGGVTADASVDKLVASVKVNDKDPGRMTNTEINKEVEKLRGISSKLNNAVVAAGRGEEKLSEIFKKSDPLSVAYAAVSKRESALHDEGKARYGPGYSSGFLRAGGARIKDG